MRVFYLMCFMAFASCRPENSKKDQLPQESATADELNQPFQNTILSGNEPAFKFPSLSSPVVDQESARIEPTFKETHAFDSIQSLYIKFANPTPIVDQIEEHEKYGNDGQQHAAIGNAVVKGSEAVSRVLNKAIDAPTNLIKKISRSTTDLLNQLGAKLIGLR